MSKSRLRFTRSEKQRLGELDAIEAKLRELVSNPATPPPAVLEATKELQRAGRERQRICETARARQKANQQRRERSTETPEAPRVRAAKPKNADEARRVDEFLARLDEPQCPMCVKERYYTGPDFGQISEGGLTLSPREFYERRPECAPWNLEGKLCSNHQNSRSE